MKIKKDTLIIFLIYIFFIIGYISLWNWQDIACIRLCSVLQFIVSLFFILLAYKIYFHKKIIILLILFLGSIIITLFLHHATGIALTYINSILLIFLFNNLVIQENSLKKIHFFIAILLSIYLLSLSYTGNSYFIYDFRGNLINPNTVGILIICCFLSWRIFLNITDLLSKIFYLFIICLTFVGLQYTECRSALLVFIVFLLLDFFNKIFAYKEYKNIIFILLFLSIFLPYIYIYIYNYGADTMFLNKALFTGRQFVWRDIIEQIKNFPLFGSGTDFKMEMGYGRETYSGHNFLLGTWKIFGIIPLWIIMRYYINCICPTKKFWKIDRISEFASISLCILFFTESIITGSFLPILVLIFLLNKVEYNDTKKQ